MPIESEEGVRSTAGVIGSFELSDVGAGQTSGPLLEQCDYALSRFVVFPAPPPP